MNVLVRARLITLDLMLDRFWRKWSYTEAGITLLDRLPMLSTSSSTMSAVRSECTNDKTTDLSFIKEARLFGPLQVPLHASADMKA